MKVLAINGGPRKNWNTATLLKSSLEGAASQGAETELIHLYDLNFKGCISCFSCKRVGGPSYGRCAVNDELRPVLDKIEECDAFVLGSPIYLSEVTGEMRSFLERLIFQYLVYDKGHTSLFKGKIRTGSIYTMNVPEQYLEKAGYAERFGSEAATIGRIFGSAEPPIYSATVFPKDCRKAFELGVKLAEK